VTIYLKYGTYNSGSLEWSDSETFSALIFNEYPETDRVVNRGLNGVEYNHLKSVRTIWKLIISANELVDSDKYEFIKNFYTAGAWKYSTDNWTTETLVNLKESGEMPVEFLENHKLLREISFTLVQKMPEGLS